VLRLPPPDVQRLRTSALALHRVGKRRHCSLLSDVTWRILALGARPVDSFLSSLLLFCSVLRKPTPNTLFYVLLLLVLFGCLMLHTACIKQL
jgi:hypothetical protein